MDVSADLTELGRTRVAVFCSGAKSILDIPRTLEYLETQGVPVYTFNPSGEFPCFYTAKSGCWVPIMSSVEQAAEVIACNEALQLQNGMVFGVPIPREFESDGDEIQMAVEQAIRESHEQGMDRLGKQVTPWLLRRVGQLAQNSVRSNVGLVLNNARTAAQCAVALAGPQYSSVAQVYDGHGPKKTSQVMVFGCASVDITAQSRQKQMFASSTTPGRIHASAGGVAHNVARATHALIKDKQAVVLVAPMANDVFGKVLLQDMLTVSCMRTDALAPSSHTAICNLLLGAHGELIHGIADMEVVEKSLTPQVVTEKLRQYRPQFIAADANLSPASLAAILLHAKSERITYLYEPTSVKKCERIIEAMQILQQMHMVPIMTPNQYELARMAARIRHVFPRVLNTMQINNLSNSTQLPQELIEDALTMTVVAHTQFIKLGARGVLLVTQNSVGQPYDVNVVHIPATKIPSDKSLNSTGAGDSFAGAIVAHLNTLDTGFYQLTLQDLIQLVHRGQRAAVRSLTSSKAVADEI